MMKTIVIYIFMAFVVLSSYATSALDAKELIREWKSYYKMNISVIPINVYFKNEKNKLNALVDYSKQKMFNVDFDIIIKQDALVLDRKSEQGHLMQFKGNHDSNTITGSFRLIKSKTQYTKGNYFPEWSENF